jgi:hypothetical protein
MSEPIGTYIKPKDGWICFHCGERFTTEGAARDHFGTTPASTPGCIIKSGDEMGLLMALRNLEDLRDRSSTVLGAAFHALKSYQYGNDAPDLAQGMAESITQLLEDFKKEREWRV